MQRKKVLELRLARRSTSQLALRFACRYRLSIRAVAICRAIGQQAFPLVAPGIGADVGRARRGVSIRGMAVTGSAFERASHGVGAAPGSAPTEVAMTHVGLPP